MWDVKGHIVLVFSQSECGQREGRDEDERGRQDGGEAPRPTPEGQALHRPALFIHSHLIFIHTCIHFIGVLLASLVRRQGSVAMAVSVRT